jgi:23S rRNA pseudouridine1911/1915/1917 synthase
MSRTRRIVYPNDLPPDRIDRFIAISFPEYSRSHVKHLIKNNSVQCNTFPVKPSHKVLSGDIVTIAVPDPVSLLIKPENIPLNILYQDRDIAVIIKSAGMVVHPSGPVISGTLVNALLYHLNDLSGINGVLRPGIVHRLDKDTSGVLVIAKNDRSHRALSDQFASRTVEKLYTALVWGTFLKNEGVIYKSITRSTSDRKKMISGTLGKKSETHYKVREEFSFLTLLDVMPKTGRTHQIRSHLSSIGHPVFGDSLYKGRNRQLSHFTAGDRIQAKQMLSGLPRQALHASEIAFLHPTAKKSMRFKAPLPADIEETLKMLL